MNRPPLAAPSRQRGTTLIVILVLLVILTLLGVTAAQQNALQERMAGSTRNRDLAFQAAEAALRDAERTLATWRSGPWPQAGCSQGLCTYSAVQANDMNYWQNTFGWQTGRNYRNPAQTLNQVAEQPRWMAEKMPDVGQTEYYRVTARGVGGETQAVVILQAVYSYTP